MYWEYTAEFGGTIDGTVEGTFYIACDVGSVGNPGGSAARMMVFLNGEEIGRQQGGSLAACTSSATELKYGVDLSGTVIAVGDVVTVGIAAWAVNAPPPLNENLHIKVGPSNPSGVNVPGLVLMGAPAIVEVPEVETFFHFTTIEGTTTVNGTTNGVQSGGWFYNWTADASQAEIHVTGAPLQGALTLVGLRDGVEMLNTTFTENGTFADVIDATGNWTFALVVEESEASFELSLVEVAEGEAPSIPPASGQPTPTGSEPEPSTPGQENETPEDGPGEDSPGLPLLLVLSALAVAALRRRP